MEERGMLCDHASLEHASCLSLSLARSLGKKSVSAHMSTHCPGTWQLARKGNPELVTDTASFPGSDLDSPQYTRHR